MRLIETIPAVALASSLGLGCSADEVQESELGLESEAGGAEGDLEFRDALPFGYSRYCSVQWPGGDWAVSFGSSDPCGVLESTEPAGFSIERAGIYSTSGLNNVVMRCAQLVWSGRAWDSKVLKMGQDYAEKHGLTHCTLTVAPANLPVFDAPFASAEIVGGNGFDFARDGGLDVGEFGQPSLIAKVVDWKGRARFNWADNHNGIDYPMPTGTPIYAVAGGTVVASHGRKVSQCDSGCSPIQEEIIITHEFTDGGVHGDDYAEHFSSYYAHLDSRAVKNGDTVVRGQLIGYSGNTGCSGGPHLHFGVKRLSNTSSELFDDDYTPVSASPNDCPREDNSPAPIDPYGWWPKKIGFDPWGWNFHDKGAMSINLWREGQVPPRE